MNLIDHEEILRRIGAGTIPIDMVQRCRDLSAYGTDSETGVCYVGFVPGSVIKVTPDELNLYASIGQILSRHAEIVVLNQTNAENAIKSVCRVVGLVIATTAATH